MDELGRDKNVRAPELQAPPAGEAVQQQEAAPAEGTPNAA
jgi:hypothetical protein